MPNSRPISGPSVPSGHENGKTVAKIQFCHPSAAKMAKTWPKISSAALPATVRVITWPVPEMLF